MVNWFPPHRYWTAIGIAGFFLNPCWTFFLWSAQLTWVTTTKRCLNPSRLPNIGCYQCVLLFRIICIFNELSLMSDGGNIVLYSKIHMYAYNHIQMPDNQWSLEPFLCCWVGKPNGMPLQSQFCCYIPETRSKCVCFIFILVWMWIVISHGL